MLRVGEYLYLCRINLPDSGKMRKERALPSLHFIREGILWEIKYRWPGGYFIFSCFSCRSFFSHKVHSLFGSRERKNKSKGKSLNLRRVFQCFRYIASCYSMNMNMAWSVRWEMALQNMFFCSAIVYAKEWRLQRIMSQRE